jgi:hypothetical protein
LAEGAIGALRVGIEPAEGPVRVQSSFRRLRAMISNASPKASAIEEWLLDEAAPGM